MILCPNKLWEITARHALQPDRRSRCPRVHHHRAHRGHCRQSECRGMHYLTTGRCLRQLVVAAYQNIVASAARHQVTGRVAGPICRLVCRRRYRRSYFRTWMRVQLQCPVGVDGRDGNESQRVRRRDAAIASAAPTKTNDPGSGTAVMET